MVWMAHEDCSASPFWTEAEQRLWRATQATYRSWKSMRARCHNENATGYRYYGGRGISVCERWRNSFDAFLADMGPRLPATTIDRIDVNGNYEPGNCRWATCSEQARNRRKFTQSTGDREMGMR